MFIRCFGHGLAAEFVSEVEPCCTTLAGTAKVQDVAKHLRKAT